jgi:hypothetical protein
MALRSDGLTSSGKVTLSPTLVVLPALPLALACGAESVPKSLLKVPPTPSLSNQSTGSSAMSGDWNADTDVGHTAFTVDPDGTKVTTAVVRVADYTCGGTFLSAEPQEVS